MNALSIAWKMRVEMLGVLAASTALQGPRTSESRLKKPRRAKDLRVKSEIRRIGLAESVVRGEHHGGGSKVVDV